MIVELLAEHHLKFLSFKGGCTGSSESTLVKMPHCWKSHVTIQIYVLSILGSDEEGGCRGRRFYSMETAKGLYEP